MGAGLPPGLSTGIVLAGGPLLALAGGWGLYRLLGRLRLSPAERLSLTLSLTPALLGLAALGGLLTGRPGPLVPVATCAALAVAGLVLRGDLTPRPSPARRGEMSVFLPLSGAERGAGGEVFPGSRSEVVPVVAGVSLYGLGTLGTTLLTPLSGGALRIGDWVAHWFLALVYAGLPLPDLRVFTNRVGDFGVISRPPLYNLESGLLVGALASGAAAPFWPFQLVTPLLALPVVAAGVLWARALGGVRAAWVFAALAGLSPFLIQNATYPWSKMVAAGLVLLFLYLIRAAALSRDAMRCRQTFIPAAFCAGLGYLAHQTTIFYVLPTLLWLVWRRPRSLFRRPVGWTLLTWGLGGVAGVAAFGPWQGWVLATYGLQATLDANPASFGADVSETFLDWLLKGGVAALGTLMPLPALMALARGAAPSLDQLMRVQLALLTGAFGLSGCWLLLRAWRARRRRVRVRAWRRRSWFVRIRRLDWLPFVVACGFLGQVMLQPNWHDTGDAAESMTPIVVLGLAVIAREALRLGPRGRWLFGGLVTVELAIYLGLWSTWAFGSAWTRDPNAVLASRYGLEHLRGVWSLAAPLGAVLLVCGLGGSSALLWRALCGSDGRTAAETKDEPRHGAARPPTSGARS